MDIIPRIVHCIVFLFILFAPIINVNYFTMLHLITIPFLMCHWYFEDVTCVLIFFEKKIRKYLLNISDSNKDCLSTRVILPIYTFSERVNKKRLYFVVFILWCISIMNIFTKINLGEISNLKDMIKIQF